MESSVRASFSSCKRLTVKIGTSSLTTDGKLDENKVKKFVGEVMSIKKGREILIVSSGAIGAGLGRLGMQSRPKELSKLQAAAAVGQGILMQVYEKYFSTYNQPIAQLLLTKEDFTSSERLANLKNTLNQLFAWDVVPIVNENDTVATEEIKIGDNDFLASYLAIHSGSQLLIILSDMDGLFTSDPKYDKNAKLIKIVREIPPEMEKSLQKQLKFGGIYSKVLAAKLANEHGIPTVLANSAQDSVLRRIIDGEEIGTLFLLK